MLMVLNYLAAMRTKSTIETADQIIQFLNYSAIYPDKVTEYRKIGLILHIYSDASYISEPEVQIRSGRFLPRIKFQHMDT